MHPTLLNTTSVPTALPKMGADHGVKGKEIPAADAAGEFNDVFTKIEQMFLEDAEPPSPVLKDTEKANLPEQDTETGSKNASDIDTGTIRTETQKDSQRSEKTARAAPMETSAQDIPNDETVLEQTTQLQDLVPSKKNARRPETPTTALLMQTQHRSPPVADRSSQVAVELPDGHSSFGMAYDGPSNSIHKFGASDKLPMAAPVQKIVGTMSKRPVPAGKEDAAQLSTPMVSANQRDDRTSVETKAVVPASSAQNKHAPLFAAPSFAKATPQGEVQQVGTQKEASPVIETRARTSLDTGEALFAGAGVSKDQSEINALRDTKARPASAADPRSGEHTKDTPVISPGTHERRGGQAQPISGIPIAQMTASMGQTPTSLKPPIAASNTPLLEWADARQGDPSLGVSRSDSIAGSTPIQNIGIRTELPHQIARQLADVVGQASNRPIEIALSPQELGRVRLAVNMVDAGIVVNVVAERPETLDLLRRHIDQLGQDFQSLGYESIAFSFSGTGPEQNTEQQTTGTAAPVEPADVEPAIQIEMRSGNPAGLDLRL